MMKSQMRSVTSLLLALPLLFGAGCYGVRSMDQLVKTHTTEKSVQVGNETRTVKHTEPWVWPIFAVGVLPCVAFDVATCPIQGLIMFCRGEGPDYTLQK